MLGNLRKIFTTTILFLLFLSLASFVANAEGDSECLSQYVGTSSLYNSNAGKNYFDSHGGSDAGSAADVSIVYGDGAIGLAPGDRAFAACLETEEGEAFPYDDGGIYSYESRGWFWNDNWGFISMACENALNDGGYLDGIVNCGNYDYGVYLEREDFADADGSRDLFGYAWGENTGWIKFRGEAKNLNGDDFTYGVKMNPDGSLSGSAWSEAGVYLNFEGVSINLEGAVDEPQANGDGYCADFTSGLCVEVVPDPLETVAVADCEDGYEVKLYFKDKFGVPFNASLVPGESMEAEVDGGQQQVLQLLSSTFVPGFGAKVVTLASTVNSIQGLGTGLKINENVSIVAAAKTGYGAIRIYWNDTVKADQTESGLDDYDFDDISQPWADTPIGDGPQGSVIYKPLVWDNFEAVLDENGTEVTGEYVSSSKISSCAPTTAANVASTTSTNPAYSFNNETFLNEVMAVGDLSPNTLELISVGYDDILDINGTEILPAFTTTANNKLNLPLNFRPAVEVNTLFEGDLQDFFLAERGLPNYFTFAVDVLAGADDVLSVLADNSSTVTLDLTYSYNETSAACPEGNGAFDLKFTEGFEDFDPDSSQIVGVIDELLSDGQFDLSAVPFLDPELSCEAAKSPSLYSTISYVIDNGFGSKPVSYYSNKLPRKVGDGVYSFFAMIRGRVDTQAVGESVGDNEILDTSGLVNIAEIRNAIFANLSLLSRGHADFAGGGNCIIEELSADTASITDCSPGGDYKLFEEDDEKILYFKNSDVNINFETPDFEGNWSIVTEGGNIFVNRDIYNDNKEGKSLALVSFRSTSEPDRSDGHIYIAPCVSDDIGVKNLQAVLIADGSVFTYSGDSDELDPDSGEPVWGSVDSPDYQLYMDASSSCQLFLEGSVYAKNTIGGNGDDVLMIGGGKLLEPPFTTAKKMRAQMYDLNYLRSYAARLEFGDSNLAVDQNCGYAPTPQEQVEIEEERLVCGEYVPCSEAEPELACDGINDTCFYTGTGSGCDLLPPDEDDELAIGLDELAEEDRYWPTYIFYTPFNRDSVLFTSEYAFTLR
jgi:hypothetical protein